MATRQQTTEALEAGYAAKSEGVGRNKCPYSIKQLNLRSWWLAGWHDCDMGY